MTAPTRIKNFQSGFRLINGDDLNNLVQVMNSSMYLNSGAPTNGTSGTGAGVTPPASLLIDTTNKTLYQNTGTLLSPTWTVFETGVAGSPGGANTNIQFNNSGAFGGSANLVWTGTALNVTGTLGLTGAINASLLSSFALSASFGSSGAAGFVDVFAPTTGKGDMKLVGADNAGNTTLTITNASQGQATTLTIPDVGGATGTFELLEAAQTISGVKTFTANPALAAAHTIKSNVASATLVTNAATVTNYITQITTESLTTASGASQAFTITLTGAAATDIAFITPAGGTNTRINLSWSAVMTTNTCTVTVANISGAALNGTLIFNLWILKA